MGDNKWEFEGWYWDGNEGYFYNGEPVSQREYFEAVKRYSDESPTEPLDLIKIDPYAIVQPDEWSWGDDGKFYHNGIEVTPQEFFDGNRQNLPRVGSKRVWEFEDYPPPDPIVDEDEERVDFASFGLPAEQVGWIEVMAVEDNPRRLGTLGLVALILIVVVAVIIGLIIYWPR